MIFPNYFPRIWRYISLILKMALHNSRQAHFVEVGEKNVAEQTTFHK